MRRETPSNQHECSACYGSGTRVEVHRSRYELERVLNKYGADDVLFVEADANAAIQFAMQGHYVQLALPLPDPDNVRFTHTPTGKPRTLAAQERAYEQALREHWRSLVVAVRGKLQSVESGISTFEQEFDRFLVPHFGAEKKRGDRRAPKAVTWLLGGSHSLAIALVAAFLVPASAVGAFALPTNVVGHLAAPFRSAVHDDAAAAGPAGNGLALARGGWSPSHGSDATSDDAARLFAMHSAGSDDVQLRTPASLSSPPATPIDLPAATPILASASSSPLPSGGGAPSGDGPPTHPPANDADTPAPDAGPATAPESSPGPVIPADPPADSAEEASDTPADGQASDPADTGTGDPSLPAGDQTLPSGTNPGNGNGQANGQGNGQANGQGNGQAPADGQAPGNGNGNGQGQGVGQGKGQGNGKGKGGK